MNGGKTKEYQYELFSIRSTIELRERCRKLYDEIDILNKEIKEQANSFESHKHSLLRQIDCLQEKLKNIPRKKKRGHASVGNPPGSESMLPSIIGVCPICFDNVRSDQHLWAIFFFL